MTITPTEPLEHREIAESGELLIKEAHDAARRRRVGWLTIFIVIALALSLIIVSVVGGAKPARQVGAANTNPTGSVAGFLPCTISSLRITVQNGDGLHHGVELMKFVNVGGHSCTLAGYPRVSALLDSAKEPGLDAAMYAPATPGALKAAIQTQWSWAGGVDVGDTPLKTFVAPTIVLAPHAGVATSTLNWIDGPNGNATCPAFNDLIIGIGKSSVTRFVRAFEPLCYEFAVTPIVRGTTGSMFVKRDYSKKANELADAKAEAENMSAAMAVLHHELSSPHRYTFGQKMQAASYVQQFSQTTVTPSPWPKLSASLRTVARESGTLGNHAVMSLMQSGYSGVVTNDYLRLLASMRSLNEVLKRLS